MLPEFPDLFGHALDCGCPRCEGRSHRDFEELERSNQDILADPDPDLVMGAGLHRGTNRETEEWAGPGGWRDRPVGDPLRADPARIRRASLSPARDSLGERVREIEARLEEDEREGGE